ncbi:phage major capsid protein [Clostridium brassicae]|uniref:Phage major capsid protein n=1 Tax=Clostridium brassicae TaxID=2999072 RepID=A0ABT4D9G5_9CLOT|nr:phage major capsid protein [Clostridium brassicae]MCY6957876.1 phage major capsid protein [Clostridium brassicae]
MEIKDMILNIKETVEKKADSEQLENIKKAIDEIQVKMQRPIIAPAIENKSKYFDGQKAARLWKCQIYAQKEKKSVIDAANEIYSNDETFVNEVKTLMSGGNAGQLIETQYYAEILPLLYNNTIFDKMGVRRLPMPKGNLTIRKMISGSTAAYIGETKAPKPSFARFASLKLSSKKLSIKTILSNDLIRDASPEADRIVRDDMVMQMRIAMDYNALYGLGTEFTPTGISNSEGVTKVTKAEVIDGDKLYSYMVTPLKKANIPMTNLGWVFNPDVFTILYNETFPNGNYKYRDELKNGRFHGFPFVETNQITTGTDAKGKVDIFFGDFDQFMIGEQMALEVKTSEDASYYDEDGNLQSAFDNDETVIKGLMIHDFGVAYGKAFTVGNFQTIA